VPPAERLTIDTPEQIALELPVAGIGSRFLAVAVDTLLQVSMYVAGFLTLAVFTPPSALRSTLASVGPAVAILFGFSVYWGYFALFELLWSGRTPGKRLAGIRVIKESGRPINAFEAIGRNVLRAIDFLPALYVVGVVCMMLNRNSRRLGDYVAGTIVVHDRQSEDVRPDPNTTAATHMSSAQLSHMPSEELVLIETYLHRRFELEPRVRNERADQIVRRITEKTGLGPDPDQPADEFLEAVARQIRDTARFRSPR
jgi:uncharacterized RDD family membrane protein YckC